MSLSVSQLQEVEQMIQTIIQQDAVVHTQEVPLAQASQITGLRTVDEVIWVLGFITKRQDLVEFCPNNQQ